MHFNILLLAPAGAVFALAFAGYLAIGIFKNSEGDSVLVEIAGAARESAGAYLKRQALGSAALFSVTFCVLTALVLIRKLPVFLPVAFLTGGLFSAIAGSAGLFIATVSGFRGLAAARSGLAPAFSIIFSSGAVVGMVVSGLCLLDLSAWYYFLNWWYSWHAVPAGADRLAVTVSTIACFGIGAGSQAVLYRLGGGIFAGAVDAGADIAGKIGTLPKESGALSLTSVLKSVGVNVGGVAGLGADLYFSYVLSIVAASAIGFTAFGMAGLSLQSVMVPLILAGTGLIASIVAIIVVKVDDNADQNKLSKAVDRGILCGSVLTALLSFPSIVSLLGSHHIGIFWAALTGLVSGLGIGLSAEYFASGKRQPAKDVAASSLTGPATVLLSGMAAGMASSAVPVIIISAAIAMSYYLSGGFYDYNLGLYGVAISSVGTLSALGIMLSSYAYGTIARSACKAEALTDRSKEAVMRMDVLGSLGDRSATIGRGFAIASSALTSLAVIVSFRARIKYMGGSLDLLTMNPGTLIGLLVGAMVPFVFCYIIVGAVRRSAGAMAVEVRRQSAEQKAIIKDNKSKPDYAGCVDALTLTVQKELVLPYLTAVLTPIAVGILAGLDSVTGMLIGSTASGLALAMMMSGSGGAWQSATRQIEEGNFGGKGSPAHDACAVGGAAGGLFMESAGPGIGMLIKFMPLVSVIFAALFITLKSVK